MSRAFSFTRGQLVNIEIGLVHLEPQKSSGYLSRQFRTGEWETCMIVGHETILTKFRSMTQTWFKVLTPIGTGWITDEFMDPIPD